MTDGHPNRYPLKESVHECTVLLLVEMGPRKRNLQEDQSVLGRND